MARTPNNEQKKSIEHFGGVLLSAGAGSGKTFVLVEHIIYLLNQFVERNEGIDSTLFRSKLRGYLTSIVMMTFTKKAAGEMALRLKARVDEESESIGTWKWEIIRECIPSLMVSTIHGVCHKLLSSGMIPNFDPEIEIATEVDQWEKIGQLVKSWYDHLDPSLIETDIVKTFLANERSLTEALVQIFGDPGLRLMWTELDPSQYTSGDLKNFFADALRLNELGTLFEYPVLVDSLPGKGKWKDYLSEFVALSSSNPLDSIQAMNQYIEFFSRHKGVRKPSAGKVDSDVLDYFEKTKTLNSLLKDFDESLNAFDEHREGIYGEWLTAFKGIFDYVDSRYQSISGLNFSDLEYYVLRALDDESVVERIAKSYKYFIVDEFQDTSFVQYEILTKLVNGDHSKLFCVGDKKQAIYGFRGGELGVFEECSNKIKHNFSLVNNYRSKKHVIDLNNRLFDFLFKKGLGFKGDDPFKVDVEYQECPLESETFGKLQRISIEVCGDPKTKIGRAEMDYLEAQQILQTTKLIVESTSEDVAILYSKLAPSRYLIAGLIREGIGFTAQMKVPLSSDPIISLFRLVTELALIHDEEKFNGDLSYVSAALRGYFDYLGFEETSDLEDRVVSFIHDIPIIGPFESFVRFVYDSGISNSNYSNNYSLIQSICRLAAGNLEKIISLLDNNSDGTYSIDFQRGTDPGRVQIMTVHASKGLEFDHVILGGIHTNGTIRSSRSYFGKEPGSFRWKCSSKQRSPFKSPAFFIESMIAKRKDFAESKRLFYVAGTRAVDALYWCDISMNGESVSYGDQSWIDGIRNWLGEIHGTEISTEIGKHIERVDVDHESIQESSSKVSTKRPLFHMDSIGIVEKVDSTDQLGTIAELSVTRLATLVHCPFKFYLKNICKLDKSDVDLFESDEKELREEVLISGVEEIQVRSSAARGTEVHEILSNSIEERKNLADKANYKEIVDWVLGQLLPKENVTFLSEVPLKFPFFGHTINGIPDLILDGKHFEIWDFKTGKRRPETEASYWFQLRAYAYSQYQLGRLDLAKSIKLVLAYVDQQELVEIVEGFDQVRDELFKVWGMTAHFSPNGEHCASCEYSDVCRQGKA